MKKIYKIRYSTAYTVSCEKRVYVQTLQCILTKKKYFHRLESDLTRNNIHPNNKRKPKIANKNAEK